MAGGYVDKDMGGADAGGEVASGIGEFDEKGKRGGAELFDGCAGGEGFGGAHGSEEIRFGVAQRSSVGGRGEPGVPAERRVADEVSTTACASARARG